MLVTTRRRLLGLAAATLGAQLLPSLPAHAQNSGQGDPDSDPDIDPNLADEFDRDFEAGGDADAEAPADETAQCFATKEFGPWTGKASNDRAGAGISEVKMTTPCTILWTSIDVSEDYDVKISMVGDPETKPALDKSFLLNDDNKIVARDAKGKVLKEAKLCGVCTDIEEDEASIILPLDFTPTMREAKSIEFGIKMGDIQDCRFSIELDSMRQALAWASEQREMLQQELDEGQCEPPEGCFLTTACCGRIGLPDDCFELTALRRYRDEVLAGSPQGRAVIERYYALAPAIVKSLRGADGEAILLRLYWRTILPCAVTAKLGLNRLTFWLYNRMMTQLIRDHIS